MVSRFAVGIGLLPPPCFGRLYFRELSFSAAREIVRILRIA